MTTVWLASHRTHHFTYLQCLVSFESTDQRCAMRVLSKFRAERNEIGMVQDYRYSQCTNRGKLRSGKVYGITWFSR